MHPLLQPSNVRRHAIADATFAQRGSSSCPASFPHLGGLVPFEGVHP